MASCPRLHATTLLQAGHSSLPQRSYAGGTVQLCGNEKWNQTPYRSGNDLPQAELFYFAAKKIGIGRVIVAATTFRRRTILLAASMVLQRFLISGGQFGNRCIHWAHSVDLRAVILDFWPRLANRCSQKAKTGANRASILDFRPRLANRCRQKVKTEAILPAQGMEHCAAAGECRMGRDFGRRSRPWLRER